MTLGRYFIYKSPVRPQLSSIQERATERTEDNCQDAGFADRHRQPEHLPRIRDHGEVNLEPLHRERPCGRMLSRPKPIAGNSNVGARLDGGMFRFLRFRISWDWGRSWGASDVVFPPTVWVVLDLGHLSAFKARTRRLGTCERTSQAVSAFSPNEKWWGAEIEFRLSGVRRSPNAASLRTD